MNSIQVWEFTDAPKKYQDLSQNGGDDVMPSPGDDILNVNHFINKFKEAVHNENLNVTFSYGLQKSLAKQVNKVDNLEYLKRKGRGVI